MQHITTTPFGRRQVTAGLLANQMIANAEAVLPSVDKYSVLDDLRTARVAYGLSDRDVTVLYALVSFHQPREIKANDGCTVYPSNRTLAERAHGMAESTLRRHLAVLVNAGLILRHDSPNGKRYAAKDTRGNVVRAFGFDLRPLVVLASQISDAARQTREAALAHRRLREDVVLLLRDTCKLISYGAEETCGDLCWETLEKQTTALRKNLRRKLDSAALTEMKTDVQTILADVHQRLGLNTETSKVSGSVSQNEQHHLNSNKKLDKSGPDVLEPIDCEECNPSKPMQMTVRTAPKEAKNEEAFEAQPTAPLALVLKACPDLLPYSCDPILHWHQLIATTTLVAKMMGISAQVWQDAQRAMGPKIAAVTCAAILQRVSDIRSPGGYLRALTARYDAQGFSPTPMIMALLNAEGR